MNYPGWLDWQRMGVNGEETRAASATPPGARGENLGCAIADILLDQNPSVGNLPVRGSRGSEIVIAVRVKG